MAADADRHLLFGLLSLQVGLIDQAQLVAAFHAWTRDKARPLADHLQALYVQTMKTPVFGPDGEPIGIQGIFWDVTERMRAEERVPSRDAP